MGHLSCPVCPHGFLADVKQLQQRVASVLSRPLHCPICSEALIGLPALHTHLAQHLPLQQDTFESNNLQQNDAPIQQNAGVSSAAREIPTTRPDHQSMFIPIMPRSVELNYCSDNHQMVNKSNRTESIPSLEKLEIRDDRLAIELSPPLNIFDEDISSNSPKSVCMQNLSRASSRCSVAGEEIRPTRDLSLTPSIEQHSCEICGLIFSSEHFLQLHKDIIHKHSECFEMCCKICSEKCVDLDSYRNHVREAHSERRYLCEECPKTFKLKGSLVVHKRMFHDGSPSTCQVCNKTFPSHTRRQFHERRYHSTNKSILKGKSAFHGTTLTHQQELKRKDEESLDRHHSIKNAKHSLEDLIEKTKLQNIERVNNYSNDNYFYFNQDANKQFLAQILNNQNVNNPVSFPNSSPIFTNTLIETKTPELTTQLTENVPSNSTDINNFIPNQSSGNLPNHNLQPKEISTSSSSDYANAKAKEQYEIVTGTSNYYAHNTNLDLYGRIQSILSKGSHQFNLNHVQFSSEMATFPMHVPSTAVHFTNAKEIVQNKQECKDFPSIVSASISQEIPFSEESVRNETNLSISSNAEMTSSIPVIDLIPSTPTLDNSPSGTKLSANHENEDSVNHCNECEQIMASSSCCNKVLLKTIADGTLKAPFTIVDIIKVSKETMDQAPSLPPPPEGGKIWTCDVCKKSFTTKYFLKKHKRLHTGETPYCCAECGKTFTFQQSYHKHLLYHSDDKPHTCSYCGRAFKEMSTLHNHVRIHTGEKPFICETCGKAFRQRVSYLVHLRIHTGVLPYKCTVCDKSFRYKVSLRSHKCVQLGKQTQATEEQSSSISKGITQLSEHHSQQDIEHQLNTTTCSVSQNAPPANGENTPPANGQNAPPANGEAFQPNPPSVYASLSATSPQVPPPQFMESTSPNHAAAVSGAILLAQPCKENSTNTMDPLNTIDISALNCPAPAQCNLTCSSSLPAYNTSRSPAMPPSSYSNRLLQSPAEAAAGVQSWASGITASVGTGNSVTAYCGDGGQLPAAAGDAVMLTLSANDAEESELDTESFFQNLFN